MKVQIKLRFENELMEWKDRSIHAEFEVIPGNGNCWISEADHAMGFGKRVTLSEKVNYIAQGAGAIESRWNFENSNQGHYSFTEYEDEQDDYGYADQKNFD
jgi:hypothetical protein